MVLMVRRSEKLSPDTWHDRQDPILLIKPRTQPRSVLALHSSADLERKPERRSLGKHITVSRTDSKWVTPSHSALWLPDLSWEDLTTGQTLIIKSYCYLHTSYQSRLLQKFLVRRRCLFITRTFLSTYKEHSAFLWLTSLLGPRSWDHEVTSLHFKEFAQNVSLHNWCSRMTTSRGLSIILNFGYWTKIFVMIISSFIDCWCMSRSCIYCWYEVPKDQGDVLDLSGLELHWRDAEVVRYLSPGP